MNTDEFFDAGLQVCREKFGKMHPVNGGFARLRAECPNIEDVEHMQLRCIQQANAVLTGRLSGYVPRRLRTGWPAAGLGPAAR